MDRREFLKQGGLVAVAGGSALGAGQSVALVVKRDAVTSSAPVRWALDELRRAVTVRDDAAFRIEVASERGVAESFSIRPIAGGLSGCGGRYDGIRVRDPGTGAALRAGHGADC